jgi:S1-C subfamily serine protease
MKHWLPGILLLASASFVCGQNANSGPRASNSAGSQHAASDSSSSALTPSQIFARVRASVVVIIAADQNGQREALGSGFVVNQDRIVTNHHVVEGMNKADVVFSDGSIKPVSNVERCVVNRVRLHARIVPREFFIQKCRAV